MKCREVLERLDEYMDGGLSGEECTHIEEHLSSCTSCSEEAESLRFLLQATSELPRHLEPDRDLWAGIEERLVDRRGRASGAASQRCWWPQLAALAAAAVLLVLVGLAVVSRPGVRDNMAVAPAPARPAAISPEVVEAEADYERARAELRAVLEEQEDGLDPETWTTIEANLAVIDGAVAEIRTALEQDPENGKLVHMLMATHRQGLELIELAARLSRET